MSITGLVLSAATFAVAALVGSAFMLYKKKLGSACEAARRDSLVTNTNAGPIEYAEKGTGFPLLSIHGAGGGFDQGLANAAEFVDEGFRTIVPSRFGYLRTPVPPDTSSAAQADAHAALLSNLNISRAVVVGVSAGACSAIELTLRHPSRVAALILISPGTYSPRSPVGVDTGRGSKFAFWLVNNGTDFVWWAAEKLAPSMLIRFLGVQPELVAVRLRSSKTG
jgi:pimeloyl-ACP methyl ester carboxylesterase